MTARKHIGPCSELTACAWLLANDYEVFRNVSPFGTTDIIAMKGKEQLLIDVKTAQQGRNKTSLTPAQIAAGVIILLVHADGRCEFYKDQRNTAGCHRCGGEFEPVSRHNIYCRDCQKPAERDRYHKWKRRVFATASLGVFLLAVFSSFSEAAHALRRDGYYHSPNSRILHHRARHASGGGGNASVFCDRVTAIGRGMDCGAMVFAHRTLPLGSSHTLCGPRGCVIARVVDRGPYVRGRSFDLSPGLARRLGVNGLGNVRIGV